MILLLKLLVAHLLGDFLLQPGSWVKDKEGRKWRSPYLYLHIAIHLVLLFIFLWDESFRTIHIFLIGLSHLLIDLGKLLLRRKIAASVLFFVDQALHLLVLLTAAAYYQHWAFSFASLVSPPVLVVLFAVLSTTVFAAVAMRILIVRWRIPEVDSEDSLRNAGKYIGMLERLLVVLFIMIGRWEAIGLLLTGKSVFRFSDLTRAKDRKLTEYILIGTLLSFTIAVGIGLVSKRLWDWALVQ